MDGTPNQPITNNYYVSPTNSIESIFGKTGGAFVKWGIAIVTLNALYKASEIIKNVKVDITVTK